MHASIISFVLAFVATQAIAQNLNQSAPFSLVLSSANSTLNGSFLDACHEGAAIEGLCLGGDPTESYAQYNFNYTAQDPPSSSNAALGTVGILVWELHGGNFNLSSPLSLSISPTSNVAVPLFTPGDDQETQIGFDKDEKMFIPQYSDDTVVPPLYGPKPLYRWYVCTTDDTYLYQTLAWVIGEGKPQNPSCQKVEVKREFI